MFVSNNLLKLFYNFMLIGMPSLTTNPINKNILHAPFLVNSYSTYINYRLNNNQYNRIKHFLREMVLRLIFSFVKTKGLGKEKIDLFKETYQKHSNVSQSTDEMVFILDLWLK